MNDPFDIRDRVAIITGGSRGLGRAMATGFAARGARVVIAARTKETCDAVVDEIRQAGGQATSAIVDMADLDNLDRLVATAVDAYGGIDILVNNAADPSLSPAEALDEETWDRVHSVNVKGPFFLCQKAFPHLAASGRGSIINVISVGVWNGGAMMQLYRSSKSALLGSTMALAKEWGQRGVRVNAIAPGTFETDMIGWMDEKSRAGSISVTPQARIADPVELVPGALYLASDASSFVTGTVLRIDGGMLAI